MYYVCDDRIPMTKEMIVAFKQLSYSTVPTSERSSGVIPSSRLSQNLLIFAIRCSDQRLDVEVVADDIL